MSVIVSQNDAEFVRAFEACEISSQDFHHRDHVRLAWIYLQLSSVEEAGKRVRMGIQRFANFHGATRKYDEALTMAWIRLVANAVDQAPAATFDELVTRFPSLLDKNTTLPT